MQTSLAHILCSDGYILMIFGHKTAIDGFFRKNTKAQNLQIFTYFPLPDWGTVLPRLSVPRLTGPRLSGRPIYSPHVVEEKIDLPQ